MFEDRMRLLVLLVLDVVVVVVVPSPSRFPSPPGPFFLAVLFFRSLSRASFSFRLIAASFARSSAISCCFCLIRLISSRMDDGFVGIESVDEEDVDVDVDDDDNKNPWDGRRRRYLRKTYTIVKRNAMAIEFSVK